jgi:hypothetical protein
MPRTVGLYSTDLMTSRVSTVILRPVHQFSVVGLPFSHHAGRFCEDFVASRKNTVYVKLTDYLRARILPRSRWSPNPCRLLAALRRGLPPAWWRVSPFLAAALPAPSVRPSALGPGFPASRHPWTALPTTRRRPGRRAVADMGSRAAAICSLKRGCSGSPSAEMDWLRSARNGSTDLQRHLIGRTIASRRVDTKCQIGDGRDLLGVAT